LMEKYQPAIGRTRFVDPVIDEEQPLRRTDRESQRALRGLSPSVSLMVGAKTIAGIGIGLLVIMAGAVGLGMAAEAVLIPSVLAKLAGGIAGGGLGMAKGLSDVRRAQ